MRTCKFCGAQFTPARTGGRRSSYCSDPCTAAGYTRKYDRAWYRNYDLQRRRGITSEDYRRMYEQQEGKCVLCKKPATGPESMHTDHDHKTGRVRGLLCAGCNLSLGWFENRIEDVLKYIRYGEGGEV